MTVIDQESLTPTTSKTRLEVIVCACDRKVKRAPKGKKKTCAELGTEKHKCCDEAIQAEDHPQIKGEKGYDSKGKPMPEGMTRMEAFKSGIGKGSCWPDAMVCDAQGNPEQLYDFKFKCPKGTPTRKQKKGGQRWIYSKGTTEWPTWTKYKNGYDQEKKYIWLGSHMNPKIKKWENPDIITNMGCRK